MKKLTTILGFALLQYAAVAQPVPAAENLRRGFDNWRSNTYLEKTFVQTDKQDYLSGEVIWWNFYCVDGTVHQPSELSKVGYVEILDAAGRPVIQGKTVVNRGKGKGSFFIPLSLGTGNYEIRAYTRWMRNQGDRYFYRKNIRIINPFRAQPAPVSLAMSKYRLQCRPESGHLVAGTQSRVALLVDGPGNKSGKGWLFNEKGDSIVAFTTNSQGLADIQFNVQSRGAYTIGITLADSIRLVADLPAVEENGLALRATPASNGNWTVETRGNIQNRQLFYLLQNRQQLLILQEVIAGTTSSLQIPAIALGEGVNQLSLVDASGQVLADRLLYKAPAGIAVSVDALQKSYSLRQPVNLRLQGLPAGSKGSYSISVSRENKLDETAPASAAAWWWLGSDLSYPAKPANSTDPVTLDPWLLLSEGRPLAFQAPLSTVFTPEYDGQQVLVTVRDAGTGKPAPHLPVQMTVTGGNPQFYLVTSDANGLCRFDMHDFYGSGTLVFRVDRPVKTGYSFELENLYAPSATVNTKPATTTLPATLAEDLKDASFAMQVRNQYTADIINRFEVPAIDSMVFYGKAAKSYLLDKYVRFVTVEEVLREYVMEAAVRLRNGKPQIFMVDQVARGLYNSEPLILLDGIPVNSEQILAIDPLKVSRLDVIDHRYIFGDYLYDGVLSFITYDGAGQELLSIPDAGVFEAEGYQIERRFNAIDHSGSEDNERTPDYRTLLFWDPQVKADKQGNGSVSFFTGDLPGRYKVTVEAVNNNGQAGKTDYYFDLTEQK